MADVHTPAQRSFNMSRIKGKDTQPEIWLRSLLHSAGFRFRLHRKDLPGRPDIVLPGSKVAVFVHGCYWHRHEGCRYTTTPASNTQFWEQKFARTIERDAENIVALQDAGWKVVVAWECQLRSNATEVLAAISTETEKRAAKGAGRGS
ncbi:very short patch repair endonuclease [Brucella anthropi]|uniref:very short patch repair endonuclease n=1 Tax=Brucella anthropi TaxID=529 RepID=UPI00124C7E67|nr:DNA mismatch endonuclease Vsr [Brucella anthropi]KAB2735806.1 DNA mismatch endonuclease Vsr [Brucella anthropi]